MTYATSISAALRATVAAKNGPLKTPGKSGKTKKRSKAQIVDEAVATQAPTAADTTSQSKQKGWGILDPLRSLLPDPVLAVFDSVFTTQNVILLLAVLLIYSWFFRSAPTGVSHGYMTTAQRQVAYEEIWKSEEAELWKWLEERVALDRTHSSVTGGSVLQGYGFQSRLAETMKERQIDEAIRTTEEKLKALKRALERERETGTTSPREKQT